jgi:Tfp pilus assembly protein PilV
MHLRPPPKSTQYCRGLSLCEIVISLALTSVSVAAIIDGYVLCAKQAETSALHFAAQAQALERLEQTRAAKWDPSSGRDEVKDFLPTVNLLDVPSPTVQRFATNITTMTVISTAPPLKAIKVQTIWGWNGKLYTNAVSTYRGPDQ